MSIIAVDTSVFIAATCIWHEQHEPCSAAIENAQDRNEILLLPAHALLETYSVLTRLPHPYRLSPNDAGTLIENNLHLFKSFPDIPPSKVPHLIQKWSNDGISGGRIYDLYIWEAGCRAKADTFLTLNPKHAPHDDPRMRVHIPA